MTIWVRTSLILILGLSAAGVYAIRARVAALDVRPEEVAAMQARLDTIPLVTEDKRFRGLRDLEPDRVVRASGAECHTAIRYEDVEGRSYRLYVGGSGRRQAWFHKPANCLPSHGWETLDESTRAFFDVPGPISTGEVRRMVVGHSGNTMLVYYWMQSGQALVPSDFGRMLERFREVLANERARPTYIVAVYVPIVAGVPEAEARTLAFIQSVWPDLWSALSEVE